MGPLVVHQEIEIDAPIEQVWTFVATREGIRRWFLADVIVLEPRAGGRYEERAVYDGEPHHAIGKVTVYDPPHTFAHTYRAQRSDGTFWPADTVVTVSLSTVGTRTRVVVEHSGFERLPVEYAQRVFEAWTGGWTVTVGRLPRTASGAAPAPETLIIRKEIEIDAPPDRVWPYVGTAAGYARWSCPPAHTHEVTLEPRVGGRFKDRMIVGSREYDSAGEVVVYDPPRRIAVAEHSAAGDRSGMQHASVFSITLTDLGGRTRVTVEHRGFETLPAARRREALESFDRGWADALAALRIVVGQESLPEPPTSTAVYRRPVSEDIDTGGPLGTGP